MVDAALTSARLLLRRFRDDDRAAFAALNADPAVMEYFPAPLTRAQSDALIERIEANFRRDGFGVWAIEAAEAAPLVGMAGLARVPDDLPCAPAVEVLWRLARPWWGRGYASEAARAAIGHGVARHGFREIVAFAVAGNRRSRRVMERLGMVHDPAGDFDHPRLAAESPLRRHVLYRLKAAGGADAVR